MNDPDDIAVYLMVFCDLLSLPVAKWNLPTFSRGRLAFLASLTALVDSIYMGLFLMIGQVGPLEHPLVIGPMGVVGTEPSCQRKDNDGEFLYVETLNRMVQSSLIRLLPLKGVSVAFCLV